MTPQEVERQIDKLLRDLIRDFGDTVPADEVLTIGQGHYERLRGEATITDFIPLLVYRFTKDGLLQIERDELHRAG